MQNPDRSGANYSGVGLIEIAPHWVVDDDGSTVSKSFDRMAYARRHDRYQPRSGNLGDAVNSHLKFPLYDLVDFLLGMKMLVNERATHEIVMGERHARRVEIASLPTGQALSNLRVFRHCSKRCF